MKRHKGFQHLGTDRRAAARAPRQRAEGLLAFLAVEVRSRFKRVTRCDIAVVPLHSALASDVRANFARYVHPICLACSDVAACRRQWRKHASALRRRPESHWHECDKGHFCGVVPVVYRQRCVAACKIVSGSSSARTFKEYVCLLEDTVAGFIARHASVLAQLESEIPSEFKDLQHVLPTLGINSFSNAPPAVLQAIRHVEQRLADPDLAVGSVACALGLHTTYLGNVFSRQTGMHLRRYIALRRFHHAAHLLTTTTLSIKQIAYQVGYVNPDAFSHAFTRVMERSPSEHRRQRRDQ